MRLEVGFFVVFSVAVEVRRKVRWGSHDEEFYYDAVGKGRALGFRVDIDDVNRVPPVEVIKAASLYGTYEVLEGRGKSKERK